MTGTHLSDAQQWIDGNFDEMLEFFRSVLRINSIQDSAAPGAPFGSGNKQALELCLAKLNDWGFKTKDMDGYVGFGEFGAGKEMIMSLGHLDVVPVGPGWKHEPFGAELDGGYVYARGATDDKGPTVASMFAMAAIKSVWSNPNVRFRQVLGCNEESGFQCVHHYVKHEEAPTFGVAPDAGWPVCHGEKGIATLMVRVPIEPSSFQLVGLSGGSRPNIVIDSAEATVEVDGSVRAIVETGIADKWDQNVFTTWNGDSLTVRATGKAAHGSTPYMGDSASERIFRFLFEISPLPTKELYETLLKIHHPSGTGLGIHGRDNDTGDLTSNVGIVGFENGSAVFTVNVRYPATWKGSDLLAMALFAQSKSTVKYSVKLETDSPSLYFPIDHPLIERIVSAYRAETGDLAEPFTMGGGTYARAVPNTVAIGTGWLGDGLAHETDERLAIDSLKKMAKIYARIFLELADAATQVA